MNEFVSVPVPLERVQEVYELLARQPRRRSVHKTTEDGYSDGWNRALVERMFLESSEPMRRILAAIANASPAWVTTKDIADASGLTVRQVVASFGPFEKRVRGRYAMSCWPFEAREFVDVGSFKYSMPSVTAEVIETLTAQAGGGA